MIIKKITTGFVIQEWDTSKNYWIKQEFIAGDQCDYEDSEGNPLGNDNAAYNEYLPFYMRQPKNIARKPRVNGNSLIVRKIIEMEMELLDRVQRKNNPDRCRCNRSQVYDFSSILSSETTKLCLKCGGYVELSQD